MPQILVTLFPASPNFLIGESSENSGILNRRVLRLRLINCKISQKQYPTFGEAFTTSSTWQVFGICRMTGRPAVTQIPVKSVLTQVGIKCTIDPLTYSHCIARGVEKPRAWGYHCLFITLFLKTTRLAAIIHAAVERCYFSSAFLSQVWPC